MCIFSACGQIIYGGIMLFCLGLTATATFYDDNGRLLSWECLTNYHECDPWENRYMGEIKTVAVFMCLALITEVISLIWNFVTFCACCCKRYIIHPLILLSFLVTVFLFVAVIVYALSFKGNIGYYATYNRDEYGISFWLAVVALILAGIDMVVAGLTVFLGERGL